MMLQPHFNTNFALDQIPVTSIGFIFKKINLPLTFFMQLTWNQLCKPLERVFKMMDNSREEVRDTDQHNHPTEGQNKGSRMGDGWQKVIIFDICDCLESHL